MLLNLLGIFTQSSYPFRMYWLVTDDGTSGFSWNNFCRNNTQATFMSHDFHKIPGNNRLRQELPERGIMGVGVLFSSLSVQGSEK
ncbi:hypothetical protein RIY08_004219 [Salmonella enterica]|nr:hypothetical protein [Salmonella enterica]